LPEFSVNGGQASIHAVSIEDHSFVQLACEKCVSAVGAEKPNRKKLFQSIAWAVMAECCFLWGASVSAWHSALQSMFLASSGIPGPKTEKSFAIFCIIGACSCSSLPCLSDATKTYGGTAKKSFAVLPITVIVFSSGSTPHYVACACSCATKFTSSQFLSEQLVPLCWTRSLELCRLQCNGARLRTC